MNKLTIVMYHYVREIKNSKYPNIKGLEFSGFKRQLDYLKENYNIVKAEDLFEFYQTRTALPERACYLTFDDGYKDHIDFVLPELIRRNIQGSFFPPAKPVIEREMLDVNRIHYILACCQNSSQLVSDLNTLCLFHSLTQEELCDYWSKYANANRYDSKEVMYIKSMLQYGLPDSIRNSILSTLFTQYVSKDPYDFAEGLYLSLADTRTLVEAGMYVGSHGYRHSWLDRDSPAAQESEIDLSLKFLNQVGAPTSTWIMCYPYGAYSPETLEILKTKRCAIGLTTKPDFADLNSHHLLELPRFDTNDFPR